MNRQNTERESNRDGKKKSIKNRHTERKGIQPIDIRTCSYLSVQEFNESLKSIIYSRVRL